MMALILIMKQMLILLRQNHTCCPNARGRQQSETVGVISKLESSEKYGNSISAVHGLK